MDMPKALELVASRIAAMAGIGRRCLSVALFVAMAAWSHAQQPSTAQDAATLNQALREELLAMGREDQSVRIGGLQELKKHGISVTDAEQLKNSKARQILQRQAKKSKLVDEKHRRRLRQIIAEHGWPGKSLVGPDGANAAWLIVQHADADVKFQRQCLALLEAAPQGEVEVQQVAYLTDRVLVNEGKPQRYGTQMGENFRPRPLEDPENVDQRRAEVDLPPLAEYIKTARQAYEELASGKPKSSEADH
jgi:hypothetical protein